NHRDGEIVDGVHESLAGPRKLKSLRPGELGNLLEVGAGGKEFVVSGDDQGFDLATRGFFPQALNRAAQRSNDRAGENIGRVRRRDPQDSAALDVAHVLILSAVLSPNLHASRQ